MQDPARREFEQKSHDFQVQLYRILGIIPDGTGYKDPVRTKNPPKKGAFLPSGKKSGSEQRSRDN